jgi:hypothetical protein
MPISSNVAGPFEGCLAGLAGLTGAVAADGAGLGMELGFDSGRDICCRGGALPTRPGPPPPPAM